VHLVLKTNRYFSGRSNYSEQDMLKTKQFLKLHLFFSRYFIHIFLHFVW
jgi:hypothetical protein